MKGQRASHRHVPGGPLILHRMFTRLNCPGRPPQFTVEFYPYSGLTHSIRLREEIAYVRFSDLLRGAPQRVLEAAGAILLARLYRRHPPRELVNLYRQYSHAGKTQKKLHARRRKRIRKKLVPPAGRHHDLVPVYDELNRQYFGGRLANPNLGWSTRPWRSQLGTFDPGLKQITINSALDRAEVPLHVLAYVLYHEMLHQKHPMKFARCRLHVHSREFREEEKQFAEYDRAVKFLERLS